MNGTIQRALCKLTTDRTDTWDMYLESVVFGLRTKKQITTKFSPFYMLFGVEARYPCEVPEMYEVSNSVESIIGEEMISRAIQMREHIDEIVKHREQKQKEKKKIPTQQSPFFSVDDIECCGLMHKVIREKVVNWKNLGLVPIQ
ncbi:hypothetical protein MHYP_G00172930 [Metynnis hypsauchen]